LSVATLVIRCLLETLRRVLFDSGLQVDEWCLKGRSEALSGKTHTGKTIRLGDDLGCLGPTAHVLGALPIEAAA
jgi:hypothetical protein